jgi:hypothetical protein
LEIQSNKTKPCVFPFKFKNRTYNGCTNIDNPNAFIWCPTKVHDNGEHISSEGLWGECSGNCEMDLYGKGMKIRKSCKLFLTLPQHMSLLTSLGTLLLLLKVLSLKVREKREI